MDALEGLDEIDIVNAFPEDSLTQGGNDGHGRGSLHWSGSLFDMTTGLTPVDNDPLPSAQHHSYGNPQYSAPRPNYMPQQTRDPYGAPQQYRPVPASRPMERPMPSTEMNSGYKMERNAPFSSTHYGAQDESKDKLLEMFKHVKKKKKLSLQKASEEIGVTKGDLQRWYGGKANDWAQRKLVEAWIYSSTNAEALESYHRESNKNITAQYSSAMPVNQFHANTRPPPQRNYHPYSRPNSVTPQNYGGPYSSHMPNAPHPHSGSGSPALTPSRPTGYGSPHQFGGANTNTINHHPHENINNFNRNPAASLQQSGYVSMLATRVKQETEQLLHQDIDGAVADYLATARNCKERIYSQHGDDVNKSDDMKYFYQTQGKVLLNRLTTICGDDVVQRAMQYISAHRHNTNSQAATGVVPYRGPESRTVLNTGASPSPYSAQAKPGNGAQVVSQRKPGMDQGQMMQLTKIWNHCCACQIMNCQYANCGKIKPAVDHQRQLRDNKRPCSVKNCNLCHLYKQLKDFSITAKNSSSDGRSNPPGPPNRPPTNQPPGAVPYGETSIARHSPYNTMPPNHGPRLFSPYSNSRGQSPHPQSRPQSSTGRQPNNDYPGSTYSQKNIKSETNNTQNKSYAQHNNVQNNVNYNNTNINYNTYNIRGGGAGTAKMNRHDEEDMSSVADMLDERKPNVSINVNVNISRNDEKAYSNNVKPEVYEPGVNAEQRSTPSYGYSKPVPSKPEKNHNYSNPREVNKPVNPYEEYDASKAYNNGNTAIHVDDDDDFAALFDDSKPPDNPGPRTFPASIPSGQPGDGRYLCVICKQNDRDSVFRPCSHCCACKPCANQVKSCPICRAEITGWSSIFLP